MQIFLINLERAKDRRDFMVSQIRQQLPDATVKRALSVDVKVPGWQMPEGAKPGGWKSDRWNLTASDIDIFRRHIDCWQKIAASGSAGLVLEDDLLFSSEFGKGVKALFQSQKQGIFRLDATAKPLLLGPASALTADFTVSRVLSLAASAAAYYVDPETANALVKSARVERTLDDFLFDPHPHLRGARGHSLPIFQLEPALAVQAQFGLYSTNSHSVPSFLVVTTRSDVKSRRNKKYTGPLAYRVRKEILRTVYRRRLKSIIKETKQKGGRWGEPVLHKDLAWN
jgi:GR25 family glycosyltransferase involved in LPS biosynthesis